MTTLNFTRTSSPRLPETTNAKESVKGKGKDKGQRKTGKQEKNENGKEEWRKKYPKDREAKTIRSTPTPITGFTLTRIRRSTA